MGALGLTSSALALVGYATDARALNLYDPELRSVLDSFNAVVAGAAAALLLIRARRSRSLTDQLLGEAFVFFSAASALSVIRHTFSPRAGETFEWAPVILRCGAAGLLVAAVLLSRRPRPTRPPSYGSRARVASLGVLAWLPFAVPGIASPVDVSGPSEIPEVSAHPVLALLLLMTALFVGYSALVIARSALQSADVMYTWLAPALVLIAFAHLHFGLTPSIYTDWFTIGDLLRSAGYVLVLWGAVHELRDHWARETRDAVSSERRRIARELHDGVVQEMGLIRMEARALARDRPSPRLDEIFAAAERGAQETRIAVYALSRDSHDAVGMLHDAVRDAAVRRGLQVTQTYDRDVLVVPTEAHHLARIACEAVSNAALHGGADKIVISLKSRGDGGELVIRDNGVGFGVKGVPVHTGAGFGLVSMRERTAELGGRLTLSSVPAGGAVITVTW